MRRDGNTRRGRLIFPGSLVRRMSTLTDRFQRWPIERVIEYTCNPRKNDHTVDQMAAAIREFGLRIPGVVQSYDRPVEA